MRTNIDLDDLLITKAMKISGLTTKRATVERALQEYVRTAEQREAIEAMRGLGWDGDLDSMREGRFFDDVRE